MGSQFHDHQLDLSLLLSGDQNPDPEHHLLLSDLNTQSPVSSPTIFLNLPPSPPPPEEAEEAIPSHMDSPEDLVLPFISRMLMEEDIDDKFFYEYPEHPALLAAEKPFLDILSNDDTTTTTITNSNSVNSVVSDDGNNISSFSSSWAYDPFELQQLQSQPFSLGEAELSSAFLRGVEEAKKFLPADDKLVIDLEAATAPAAAGFASAPPDSLVVKQEVDAGSASVTRGRKNPHPDDGGELDVEEGRSNKQSAVAKEELDVKEMFDRVLLCKQDVCAQEMENLRAAMQSKNAPSSGQGNGKGGRRGGRRHSREVVDLRTLLVHCAQSVATDDHRSANELLKQIRQHASPTGNATQRLAHCFVDGLQARLVGTGSQVYHSLMAKRTSVADILKAYQLYMMACPFKKVSFLFSNHTILNAAAGATKLHIIDYGIHHGFQWPCLLQHLGKREGGPPYLRITGIDLPQPGFRPAERIEETGRRLKEYADEFNVPFKYQAIAAKSESIRVEDLDIDPDEILVVNSLYQFKNLMDESVIIDSPRDIVLENIRKMRPHVFIHAIVNGSYSAPFFVTRFREALFHFSALFDMLEATTPRESDQRLLIERDLFGRSALNVISCEGSERVERPETYKQWQVRTLRAGLKQLPLNQSIVDMARNKVKKCYHKDFVVDVDHQWLLQGWKGRILFGISTWVPDDV